MKAMTRSEFIRLAKRFFRPSSICDYPSETEAEDAAEHLADLREERGDAPWGCHDNMNTLENAPHSAPGLGAKE